MDRFDSDESAQIIVIAALLIAVLFVGLALVLNSAIYAENMGTRGETSTSDAVASGTNTQERIERLLATENYRYEDVSYPDRRGRIRSNLSDWDSLMGSREARSGNSFVSTASRMTNGTRIAQKEYGTFMPAESTLLDKVSAGIFGWLTDDFRIDPLGLGDKKNWIVANDTNVRSFEMTVNRSDLQESDPSIVETVFDPLDTAITGSNLFWVEANRTASPNRYSRIYLFNDEGNDSVEVVVADYESGSLQKTESCSATGSHVRLRVTEGELIGDEGSVPCPALKDTTNGGPLDLHYAGADEVNGTYQFLAGRSETEFRDSLEDRYGLLLENALDSVADFLLELLGQDDLTSDLLYHDSSTTDGPYTDTAIYDLTIQTTYRDGRITYTRNVTYPPTAR